MRYDDASGSFGSSAAAGPDARNDTDALAAGSRGPATGNTISGADTITGKAGADIIGDAPGKIVALEGAGGSDTSNGSESLQVAGRYGTLRMDADGSYSYRPNGPAPETARDVFNYTLADNSGARDSASLTIDIGHTPAMTEMQQIVPGPDGVVTLPPGVELSDVHVVGRNLVINMPDGSQMVIIDGAVFVPQLVLNGVEVPAANVAALLIDAEPKPAAGTPQSGGGNFAVDVGPLDPGVPLGDLLPPTELTYTPPTFEEVGIVVDRDPEILIDPGNGIPVVNAVDSVNESGLPARVINGQQEPAGSAASGSGETTTGTIVYDSPDDPNSISITVNGVTTVITGPGQVIAGQWGNLTITSVADGAIGYSYTLRDNTPGDTTHDDFIVTITDNDGDTDTATLRIDIVDDVPTANADTDSVAEDGPIVATGNILTGVDVVGGDANTSDGTADVTGADNATITAFSGAGGTGTFGVSLAGQHGSLVLNANGTYTYTLNNQSAAVQALDTGETLTETYNYSITDGDGDIRSTTLTITITGTNDAPVANPDTNWVQEDGPLTASGNVLQNVSHPGDPSPSMTFADVADTDVDIETLTVTPATINGTYGQLVLNADGSYTYTLYTQAQNPAAFAAVQALDDLETLSESFPYTASDGTATASSTLTVTIFGNNDAPVAQPDTNWVKEDGPTSATGNVLQDVPHPGDPSPSMTFADVADSDVDGDTLTVTPATINGQYGQLVLQADGSYTYTLYTQAQNAAAYAAVQALDDNETLTESFNYTASDGTTTASSTLTVTVFGTNDAPVANPDTNWVQEDGPTSATGNVLQNVPHPGDPSPTLTFADVADTDVDVEPLTVTPATINGLYGQLVLQADGSYVYTLYTQAQNPTAFATVQALGANETLQEQFPYTVSDGTASTGSTLTITIFGNNDLPTGVAGTATVSEEGLPGGIPDSNPVPSDNSNSASDLDGDLNFVDPDGDPVTYSLGIPTGTFRDAATDAVVTWNVTTVGNIQTLTGSVAAGTVITVTLNTTTGEYDVVLSRPMDHGADGNTESEFNIVVPVTVSDGTGSTPTTITIDVEDDKPAASAGTIARVVDEDGLSGGNTSGGIHDEPGFATVVTGSVATLFNSGGDQPLTYSLLQNTSGLPQGLRSQGDLVTYSVNPAGTVLTATASDGRPVFTFTLNPDGSYEFELLDQLDHPALEGTAGDDTENPPADDIYIALGSVIQATDADGDTATAAAGGLVIQVDDDSPAAYTTPPGTATGVNAPGTTDTESLNLPSIGADEPAVVSFNVANGTPVLDTNGKAVTSNGDPLYYTINPNDPTILEARTSATPGQGELIFQIDINGGNYTYTQIGEITSVSLMSITNLSSVGGGNVDAKAINTPTQFDLILTTKAGDSVNTNATEIGISDGNSFKPGEILRVDLIQNVSVTSDGGDDILNFGEYYSATGYRQDVSGLAPGQRASFTVKAIVVNDAPGSVPADPADGDNVFFGDTNDTVVAVTQLNIYNDSGQLVNPTAYAGLGITVTPLAGGGYTITGLPNNYDFEITSNTLFNAVQIEAIAGTDTFKLGFIDLTTVVETAVNLQVPVEVTDFDGDAVGNVININLSPGVNSANQSVVVDEAALDANGSNPSSTGETSGGTLVGSGGTGPYTFTLTGPNANGTGTSADGAYGTLTLNPTTGVYSYTLDTAFDGPTANNGVTIEFGAESFTYEMEDANGLVTVGTITVNIRDDVPSVSVGATDPSGAAETLDSETVGGTSTDTFDFSSSFSTLTVPGADGLAAPVATNYAIVFDASYTEGAATTLTSGGDTIYLYRDASGTITGSTAGPNNEAGMNAGNTVFTVTVSAAGVVTLTQFAPIDHAVGSDTAPLPADLLNLTYTATVTDNDGDVDSDSASLDLGGNLRFIDAGPTANDDTDSIAPGDFGVATGNVITADEVNNAIEDANATDGVADVSGPDVPVRVSAVSFTLNDADPTTNSATQNITDGSFVTINGQYGVLTLWSNGDYSYDRDPGTPGGVTDVFTYTLSDSDGDTDQATLTINIGANPPVATSATAKVDDDGLAGPPAPNPDGNNDLAANDASETGVGIGNERFYTGSLATSVTGGDGDVDFRLVEPADGATIGQETVNYSLTDNGAGIQTLTATVAAGARIGTVLFTVTLDQETGAYTVELKDNVLHGDDANNDEDGIEVTAAISFIARDASNSDSNPGTLTIQFNDDVPTAVNDTASQAPGATENQAFTIDALGNDRFGADGVNTADATKVVIVSQATQGTVTYSTTTGLFTYTPNNSDGGSTSTSDSFTYKIIDADGDESQATVNITLRPDSTPQTVNVVAAVDDDGLVVPPDAALTAEAGDIDANAGEPGATASEAVYSGQINVNFGGDTGTVDFSNLHGTFGVVGTERVQYSWDAATNTLLAEVAAVGTDLVTPQARAGVDLFQVVLSPSGAYTVTLLDNVLHAAGGNNENSAPVVDLNYRAVETGGFDATTTGKLSITFNDDIPTLGTIQNGFANNNPATVTLTTGALNFSVGADSPADVTSITLNTTGVTSGGMALVTVFNPATNTLTAYQDANASGTYDAGDTVEVFTLAVDPSGNGQYTFDLKAPLDGTPVPTAIGGSSSFGAGPTEQGQILETATGTDLSVVSGYRSTGSFNITNWLNGTDLTPAMIETRGVNGSTAGWGIDDNNFNGTGELFLFDFGSQPLANPDGAGTGYEPPAGTTLPNISYATFDFINYKSGAGTAGDDILYVVNYTDGSFDSGEIPAVNVDGTPWTFTADPGKFIADIQFYSGVIENGSAQDLPPGKVELVSVGVINSSIDKTLSFTVNLEDADGDAVSGSFTINVKDGNTPSTATASATNMMFSQEAIGSDGDSSFSLSGFEDSMQHKHGFSPANNNSNYAMMGAVAAAGIMAMPAAASTSGIGFNPVHSMADFSIAAAAPSLSAHGGELVSGIGGLAPMLSVGSHSQAAVEYGAMGQKLEAIDLDLDLAGHDISAQAHSMPLLQGTSLAATEAANWSFTGQGVAMPSVEMLMAANGLEGGAKSTGEVSRVLADALAGGGASTIDAILDGLPNHGTGGDSGIANLLASQGGGGVPGWDMAGFAGFSAQQTPTMLEAMQFHHDAVQTAA